MIRVGIVGTGLIAREHAQAISMVSSKKIVLRAAADVDSNRLEEFANAFEVQQKFSDADQLIRDDKIDLISITTPPVVHESIAVKALESGKFVLCEKPIAQSLVSAARILEAAKKYPGKLSVSHQLRYEPAFQRLAWLCENKWLGALESALIERHGFIPHTVHGSKGWWGSWEVAGGGVLMTQLIHQIDMLMLALGNPVSVTAQMDTRFTEIESEDFLDATIRFEAGATARCIASVNSGRQDGRFRIEGSDGAVELPWKFETKNPSNLNQATDALNRALPHTRPASASIAARIVRKIKCKLGFPHQALTPHAELYRDIADCVSDGNPLRLAAAEESNHSNFAWPFTRLE